MTGTFNDPTVDKFNNLSLFFSLKLNHIFQIIFFLKYTKEWGSQTKLAFQIKLVVLKFYMRKKNPKLVMLDADL